MEAIKKIRGKYSVDKKITVKHFLRKNKENNEHKFSIYIQLTVDRKMAQFKSKIIPYSIIEENEWVKGNYGFYKRCIERDKGLIEYIVNELNPFDDDKFDIKKVSNIYNLEKVDLEYIFNLALMWEINDFYKERRVTGSMNPASYLGLYKDSKSEPNLKVKASEFKSKIWYLDALIFHLCHFGSRNERYVMLKPSIYDYISGNFIESVKELKMFDNNEEKEIKNLIDDMKRLFELHSKEILNFK